MAVKKVTVPELGSVHLYKRRGAKGMRLSITNQGNIRVSLPTWLPYTAAIQFALSKKDWIESQKPPQAALVHGGQIGKAHRVLFVPEANRQTVAARVTGSEIRIHHPLTLTNQSEAVQSAARRASIRALKAQAEQLLPQRLATLASQHDFDYQSVQIKQLKSRWGSCSEQKVIALSCFLMQLPWHLIDYVLLHELVHTKVMAHGPVFWQELEQYIPDLRARRKEIKTYRPVLLTQ